MELSMDELRTLVRLFTVGTDVVDAGDLKLENYVSNSLQDASLIDANDGTVSFMRTGKVAVFRRFDEIE